jgi:hypothetical protein
MLQSMKPDVCKTTLIGREIPTFFKTSLVRGKVGTSPGQYDQGRGDVADVTALTIPMNHFQFIDLIHMYMNVCICTH